MTRTCAPRVPERATSARARARSGAVQRLVSPAVNGQYGLYPGSPGGRSWQVGAAWSGPPAFATMRPRSSAKASARRACTLLNGGAVGVQEDPVRLRCRRGVELRRVLRPRLREQVGGHARLGHVDPSGCCREEGAARALAGLPFPCARFVLHSIVSGSPAGWAARDHTWNSGLRTRRTYRCGVKAATSYGPVPGTGFVPPTGVPFGTIERERASRACRGTRGRAATRWNVTVRPASLVTIPRERSQVAGCAWQRGSPDDAGVEVEARRRLALVLARRARTRGRAARTWHGRRPASPPSRSRSGCPVAAGTSTSARRSDGCGRLVGEVRDERVAVDPADALEADEAVVRHREESHVPT